MRGVSLAVGYIPLVDSAPLIVAQEMGFAAEEGLDLDLKRAPSWSSLRDMLVFGRVDAAHMLAPVPVASALGLGNTGTVLNAISVLSVNGNVIGVSAEMAQRLRDIGHDFRFNDAFAAGHALIKAAPKRLRIAVPFPFSMHAEMLYYWLSTLGFPAPQSIDIRTVPPPLMADAMRAGDVDAFCVGEPWGTFVVEEALGALLLPSSAIWSFAPEKVLAVRSDWAADQPALSGRLIRAAWRAGRWLSDPDNRILAAEMLSREPYLNMPPEMIDRALSGKLTVTPQGLQRTVPGFLRFHREQATFPWDSQAQWIAHQLASRMGLDRHAAMVTAAQVFRGDLYRAALAGLDSSMPAQNSRVEGQASLYQTDSRTETSKDNTRDTAVDFSGSADFHDGNRFFDGQIFDPHKQ